MTYLLSLMNTSASQSNPLRNLTEEELAEIDSFWREEGKSASRRRYLRYYYRNREKFLIKKRNGARGKPNEYVEKVTIKSGLIV